MVLRPKFTWEKMSRICYDCSPAVHIKLHCYGFGTEASSGPQRLFMAGLLSVHLSWITDLLQESLRRCQKHAAILETNLCAVAAALRSYKPHPRAAWSSVSCSFPGLLQFSAVVRWNPELMLCSLLSKSVSAGEMPCPGRRNQEAILLVCQDALQSQKLNLTSVQPRSLQSMACRMSQQEFVVSVCSSELYTFPQLEAASQGCSMMYSCVLQCKSCQAVWIRVGFGVATRCGFSLLVPSVVCKHS